MTIKVLAAQAPLVPAEKIGQEEERRRLTLEALSDVDSRLVINHQSVQAWAESLDSETPVPTPH